MKKTRRAGRRRRRLRLRRARERSGGGRRGAASRRRGRRTLRTLRAATLLLLLLRAAKAAARTRARTPAPLYRALARRTGKPVRVSAAARRWCWCRPRWRRGRWRLFQARRRVDGDVRGVRPRRGFLRAVVHDQPRDADSLRRPSLDAQARGAVRGHLRHAEGAGVRPRGAPVLAPHPRVPVAGGAVRVHEDHGGGRAPGAPFEEKRTESGGERRPRRGGAPVKERRSIGIEGSKNRRRRRRGDGLRRRAGRTAGGWRAAASEEKTVFWRRGRREGPRRGERATSRARSGALGASRRSCYTSLS